MNKRETHIVTGMTKDLAVNRFEPSYVYDAHNIRIRTVNNNSTLLSVTNEKGTAEFTFTSESVPIKGIILGSASFTNTLVLFTTYEGTPQEDYIYRIDFAEDFNSATCSYLFDGTANSISLGFDVLHPIEALAVYENESIQKVYWVDGKNQPRMINICKGEQSDLVDAFDFNREIGADAKIKVTKYNSGGEFRPGTVQYCFNYFNKFGQETNIVDVSPLYYISPKDSGLAADDVSGCSFQITFEGLNTNFEFVRLYAIYRSSENAVPNVRIVGDYSTSNVDVDVYTPNNDFTAIITQEDEVIDTIPYDNLYLTDSNGTIIGNIHNLLADADPIDPNIYVIPVEDRYLLDNRAPLYNGYYSVVTGGGTHHGIPGRQIIRVLDDPSNRTYSILGQTGGNRELRKGTFSHELVYQSISIIDTGVYGSTLDAEALLFLGGQYFIAETLADKDNTLFFGNIKNEIPNIGNLSISPLLGKLKEINKHIELNGPANVESSLFDSNGDVLTYADFLPKSLTPSPYEKDNNRASTAIKTFKARENYRLGFIAQYKTGQWSEVIWLGDFDEEQLAGLNHFFPNDSDGVMQWGQQLRTAGFTATLRYTISNLLLDNGFIKVAPVVVYPKISDRYVICQGLLCPSIFNISSRAENAPFAQCDWRFRRGYSWNRIEEEIQCNATKELHDNNASAAHFGDIYAPKVPFAYYITKPDSVAMAETHQMDTRAFRGYFGNEFYSDPNILTFHSPDIDSSEELLPQDIKNLKLRIVGYSNGGFSTYKVDPSDTYYTTTENEIESYIHYYTELESLGFGKNSELLIKDSTKVTPSEYFTYYTTGSGPGFRSEVYTEHFGGPLKINGFKDCSVHVVDDELKADTDEGNADFYINWFTYLWHRNGSLNNQNALSDTDIKNAIVRTALYKRKVVSEKAFGYTTFLKRAYVYPQIDKLEVPIKEVNICDSDLQTVIQEIQYKKGSVYSGAIDTSIFPVLADYSSGADEPIKFFDDFDNSTQYYGADLSEGYPVRRAGQAMHGYSEGVPPGSLLYLCDPIDSVGTDGVAIKYNTTRHIVVSLQSDSDTGILQLGKPFDEESTHYIFWLDDSKTLEGVYLDNHFYNENQSIQQIDYGFIDNCIYIGELYRDMTAEQKAARFGGNTPEALTANIWTLAGEAVKLVADQPATLYYKEGDTYFGRYDCLKSYPLTPQDKQSIVSIYSTEVESRVNLDFRYGKTMNLDDNTLVTPENFNLYNHPGYEQTNQYFTYKTLDYDRYIFNTDGSKYIQDFPNMITWSLEKTLGEDVDKWTSIPMTSTLDLDGTKGEITKLARFNNDIYAFQDKAFAQVLFNSRVQIPVSDGVPIEITNGYKVEGKRYISESIGMSNKWSLGITPYAMYFADDEKNSIYAFNGQLTDLTSNKGMKTWMYDEGNAFRSKWNPKDYGNLRTFYDKVYGDVYFTVGNTSLVFSEPLGNFTSFMDYGGVPLMGNMGNKFLAFTAEEDTAKMWDMWAGDYNTFFGEFKPYWMTFIANTDPTVDKVFNNLEWRSTLYDKDGNYLPHNTFDTLRVWHEHQDTGCVAIKDTFGLPCLLKKKFNAFRTFIPRDIKGLWSKPNMQRIRNPWAYIRLAKTKENTDQMVFTDLNVDFFE